MGMYTQIRGWLNVDSIGDYQGKNFEEIERKLLSAQEGFQRDITIESSRKWVCQDTYAHRGGNGSTYIFYGTELKNYNSDAEQWIKYLLDFFPNAEGRIDFQYEEDECYHYYWLIAKGKIVKEDTEEIYCEGYGNMYK